MTSIRGSTSSPRAIILARCSFGLGESVSAAELLPSLAVQPRLCAVAAESSFASFHEIACMGQPFHLGVWFGRTILRPVVEFAFLYVRWKYDELDLRPVSPEKSPAAAGVPLLLIHGPIDGYIPLHHSRLIHASNPNTGKFPTRIITRIIAVP